MLSLFISIGFAACSNDSNNDDYSDSYYSLTFWGEETFLERDWENSMKRSPYLLLEFGEGIPKGSAWHLSCDESWVKLRSTNGKVSSKYDEVPVTIENNTNYDDREANIYLDVDNGLPLYNGTVTIRQYGCEHYLGVGRSLSLKTNRSIASSSLLTIGQIKVYQIMDIDWGDGSKDVLTRDNFYSTSNLSISHQYTSNGTYNVKLRFAPENDRVSFSFTIDGNQGIEEIAYYQDGNVRVGINDSKKVYVNYNETNGFSVNQY